MSPIRILTILRLNADGRMSHRFDYCPDERVHGVCFYVTGCRVCEALQAIRRRTESA